MPRACGFAAIAPLILVLCPSVSPAQVGGAAPADDPAYDHSAPAPPADSRVSLVLEPGGRQVLLVKYPWKVHARPSVEVRLLSPGEADDQRVQPMYFRWKHMKGDTTVAVYRCQDRCDDVPVRATLATDDPPEVLGQRNSLGKPAVCVARWTNTDPRLRAEPGAAAAFPLLDAWSVDEKMLYLDLPEDYFAAPGTLRMWLLRDDQVVWTEKLDWAGTGKAAAKPKAKPASKAQPADAAGGEPPAATRPKPSQPSKPATPRPKAKPKSKEKEPAEEEGGNP